MNKDVLYDIETLRTIDIPIVAQILVDSFETNPCYSLIFRSKEKRREGLFWLFKTNLHLLNNRESLTYVVRLKSTGAIIGTYSLVPPTGVKTRFADYSAIGITKFIQQFGLNSLYRMLRLDNLNKRTLNKAIKCSTYWYLSMVVIKKEFRGTGIGSYAIRQCLQNVKDSYPDVLTIGLTTQLPENIIFYSKLGFEQIDEGEIPFFKDSYYNYTLKYQIDEREPNRPTARNPISFTKPKASPWVRI